MEWQIKTIARNSTLSGEAFKPGDRVVCLIFMGGVGELGRADDESNTASETMASAEDFFFSLFENESPDTKEESDMLKHLLSLMLERKRVLRAIGDRKSTGEQSYRHVKTKQMIQVPIMDISTKLMLKIEDTIGDIIL